MIPIHIHFYIKIVYTPINIYNILNKKTVRILFQIIFIDKILIYIYIHVQLLEIHINTFIITSDHIYRVITFHMINFRFVFWHIHINTCRTF